MSSSVTDEQISEEDAKALGVSTKHSRMANGEKRFRLTNRDGTAYIRTEATAASGWQKSHFHERVLETYIVQYGEMALVEWIDGDLRVRLLAPNQIVTTQPDIPHNVYLFANSIIHTVKHGREGQVGDWHKFTKLDELTCVLSESDIRRLAGSGVS